MSFSNPFVSHHGSSWVVVTGGSGDAVCTAAAVVRLLQPDEPRIEVTQADKVHTLAPQTWPQHSRVVLVGLAVSKPQPTKTKAFLRSLVDNGHELVAIIDEHARTEWESVLEEVGIDISELLIEPQSQEHGEFRSAGSVLRRALGANIEPHIDALLDAADLCDRRAFWDANIAFYVNACIKSDIKSGQRRVALIRHFARILRKADFMDEWIEEYEVILERHSRIIKDREELGFGLVRVVIDGEVDMTSLTYDLYSEPVNARVVMCEGMFFDQEADGKVRKLALGTDERRLKLFKRLRDSGVDCTGMDHKPFVKLQDEQRAVEVLLELLRTTEEEDDLIEGTNGNAT
ncbi:MAG: hypothetical protein KDD66_05010 [Bdellovibrionales bacterium]|nr:hypothetical protein [Bdellovibrionales bacterium]